MGRFPHLQRALPPVLAWTKETALPFWGSVGVDEARGGFHERLDLFGQPILTAPRRLMVQGRQLFVYSTAAVLGWYPDGRRLADRCVEYILQAFYQVDGKPGWVHALGPDGTVRNPMRDAYGHAFVLLGLARYLRLTADSQILSIVDSTLAFLDESLASNQGGYIDAVPAADAIRRQNPHMHLFEAFMALYEATGRAEYLARAAAIFDVFSTRFFQPLTGTLCEYLTAELKPLPDRTGRIVEPGHHFEWVWLLRQFQRMSGRNTEAYASALYEFADRHGWDDDGFIVDELDATGSVVTRSRRTWPHTEGLKANLVEGEGGRPGSDERGAQCLARLQGAFLGRLIPAGWLDRISAEGAPISDFIPASTFYHVFGGVTEAVRVTSAPSQA
jgi:mannose/cellobiose epimerase-like protein (N-acyl-D-glucosamine 2-epimerase family)